jgi:transposase
MEQEGQANKRHRRRHDKELKRQVLVACAEPGASVAAVAMAHGLNANLVHKWRRVAERASGRSVQKREDVFVPVSVAPAVPLVTRDIQIELRRGPVSVNVSWPLGAAGECAAWLRELLR